MTYKKTNSDKRKIFQENIKLFIRRILSTNILKWLKKIIKLWIKFLI